MPVVLRLRGRRFFSPSPEAIRGDEQPEEQLPTGIILQAH
jgi:hypothetical protein